MTSKITATYNASDFQDSNVYDYTTLAWHNTSETFNLLILHNYWYRVEHCNTLVKLWHHCCDSDIESENTLQILFDCNFWQEWGGVHYSYCIVLNNNVCIELNATTTKVGMAMQLKKHVGITAFP